MKYLARTTLVYLLFGSAPLLAEVEIRQAYVRGLPPGTGNTAAYMTLVNHSAAPIELIGASSPIAGSVMLHKTVDHDGMLHMEHMAKAVIPAGGELVLASGGMHLMLMKLHAQPQPGDEVELTLEFSDGTTQQITLAVRSVLDTGSP